MPKERTVDLPYAFDTVWDAASLVLQRARWNVTRADKALGHFQVKAVMDLLTSVETFYIDLARIDNNSTRVRMGGTVTYPPFDLTMSDQYIDSFLSKLESTLKSPG